jgi:threonine aldolase
MDPAELFKNVSSLTFCLSKGLCAPVGSMVVGNKDFITRLKINRKMLGGVIRKPGVLAGPALLAMKTTRF